MLLLLSSWCSSLDIITIQISGVEIRTTMMIMIVIMIAGMAMTTTTTMLMKTCDVRPMWKWETREMKSLFMAPSVNNFMQQLPKALKHHHFATNNISTTPLQPGINEWMNACLIERVHVWMNVWLIDSMNEWMNECTNEWMSDWTIDWLIEWMNK